MAHLAVKVAVMAGAIAFGSGLIWLRVRSTPVPRQASLPSAPSDQAAAPAQGDRVLMPGSKSFSGGTVLLSGPLNTQPAQAVNDRTFLGSSKESATIVDPKLFTVTTGATTATTDPTSVKVLDGTIIMGSATAPGAAAPPVRVFMGGSKSAAVVDTKTLQGTVTVLPGTGTITLTLAGPATQAATQPATAAAVTERVMMFSSKSGPPIDPKTIQGFITPSTAPATQR